MVLLFCSSAGPLKVVVAFGSPTVKAPSESSPKTASEEPSSTIADELSDVEHAVKVHRANALISIEKYFLNIIIPY